jgi:hypothetical protein
MKLLMYLGNDLIDAIIIQREDLQQPGYLGKFKRCLKQKYEDLIQQFQDAPEFLIETDPVQLPDELKNAS